MRPMKKELTKLQKDKLMAFTINGKPVVEEIWYEEDFGEMSCWLSLKDGFNWDGCSCVHESSFKDLVDALKHVVEGEPY